MARKNIQNEKFGKLTAIEDVGENKYKRRLWKCICECGTVKIIPANALLSGNSKTCGCGLYQQSKGKNNPLFKGYKDISQRYYGNIKRGAKHRNINFNITIEYIGDLLEKQNYKCAISGLPIYFNGWKDISASLDRIDSTKGYTNNNVQWVHKDINKMKQEFPLNYFRDLCEKVISYGV